MDRIESYARAMFEVASAEGTLPMVEDEIHTFSQALQSNDELREKLSDASIPAPLREQIVRDVLGVQATSTTTSLVGMIVANGRITDLPAMTGLLMERTAAAANRTVAEVRSAVDLDADQRTRLATALEKATGKAVEIKVIVDESVKGGAITTIGETVIDGSVSSRLGQLRENMSS